MSWKDSFVTITFPSKVIFTSASLLLLLVHMGIFGGDLYHFTVTQKFDLMSFHGTTVLLVSHVMSFYWALLATFYTLEANDKVLRGFALTSLVMNFTLFVGRFCLDYLTIEYREEIY
ncbi:cation channel sperm-associated auxiliary subunit TMEM262 [Eretmochelys imbricata]